MTGTRGSLMQESATCRFTLIGCYMTKRDSHTYTHSSILKTLGNNMQTMWAFPGFKKWTHCFIPFKCCLVSVEVLQFVTAYILMLMLPCFRFHASLSQCVPALQPKVKENPPWNQTCKAFESHNVSQSSPQHQRENKQSTEKQVPHKPVSRQYGVSSH